MAELDVLVVGAGIAGISAAAALAERGVGAVLVERNGFSVGGRVALYPPVRFEYQGREWTFSMEHGIHGWWRQYRNFLSALERHGLSHRLVDAYDQAVIFRAGEQVYVTNVGRETQVTPVPEPLHHAQLLLKRNIQRMMSWSDVPRLAVVLGRILETVAFAPGDPRHRERYDGLDVNDYSRGVPYFYRAFLRSLSRSGFFSDPQYVSLWAFLVALQHYVFLNRADQRFAFARGPVAREFLEPLLRRVEAAGGRVHRGVLVERVQRREGGGWRLHWRAAEDAPAREAPFDGAGGAVDARNLVLAVDVEGGKALIERSPDLAATYPALSVFEGRRATAVRLWWARAPSERVGESGVFAGRTLADNYFWLHRFQDEFVRWHLETGGSACECHLYAPPYKHNLPDDEIIRRAAEDVSSAFPEVRGSLLHGAVVRNRATHIDFPKGCAHAFPSVRTDYPDLVRCGDWVEGGNVLYMERAFKTGMLAANALLERRGLEPLPVEEPLPPTLHVRVLQRGLRALDRLAPWVWPTRAGQGPAGEGGGA